jgi:DNA-entry nuclease
MKIMKKLFKAMMCLLIFGLLGGCSQKAATISAAGSQHSHLVKQERRLQKVSSSLKEKLAVKRYQSSSMKAQWKSQQSSLQTQALQSSQIASSAAASSAASISSTQATTASSITAAQAASQVTTGQSKEIIGNKNSHIYHVPGQAGYKMNAANAVYFSTEAQAQAAGYRKALR